MILKRRYSENSDFRYLVSELDKDLVVKNGESNTFFAQYNKIDHIKNVVVPFVDHEPAGCGAMNRTMEKLWK